MEKRRFIEILETICPPELAEAWDNSGMQIGTSGKEVNRVLVALEVTEAVISEAESICADLILTHHPLLFHPAANICEDTVIGDYIHRLIRSGISVYAAHTNFDKTEGGNNDYIGRLLPVENVRHVAGTDGFGRMGDTLFDMTFLEFAHQTADAFGVEERHFRFVGELSREIRTVGWCSGAGADFLQAAFDAGCNLYLTGDLGYHAAQLAKEMGLCVLDAGHYGSERIFAENMAELLREALSGEEIEILESNQDLNPFV